MTAIAGGADISNPAHVVIRLVPQAPVNGATFSSYLGGLKLELVDANVGTDISDEADVSPLTLKLTRATGISAGAFVYSAEQTTISPVGSNGHGLTITAVTQDSTTSATVTLSDTLPKQVPAGIPVGAQLSPVPGMVAAP